jgi:hypothetical protein
VNPRMARCRLCGATGALWLNRSWFASDGYIRTVCWLCEGSGRTRTNWAADREMVSRQKQKRALRACFAHVERAALPDPHKEPNP